MTTVHVVMHDEPPSRVIIAIEYLRSLSSKTKTHGAMNDLQFYEIPGQKLTSAELNAQANAANLLSAYFAGKMSPNAWERKLLKRVSSAPILPPPDPDNCDCPACTKTKSVVDSTHIGKE